MKIIDLFSGVGGLTFGFEQAGFEPLLAVEFNKSISEGYEKNFPNSSVLLGDLSTLPLSNIFDRYKKEDLFVIGGPPCQGFSQKGKRLGLSDERNFLFKKYIDVVKILNPQGFLIENVPGLLSVEGGFFLNEISQLFSDLGYSIYHKVLDASDYGVPQKRKRAFVVGLHSSKTFKWPKKIDKQVSVEEAISDLPRLNAGQGSFETEYQLPAQSEYQELMRMHSSKIYNHIATNHSDLVLERLKLIPEGGTRNDLPKEHLTKSIYSGTWARLINSEPSRTITTRFDTPSSGMFTLPDQDRCLTVREAARLQSFPDRFIFTGNKTSQMLQVGNAVPPILAQKIAESIKSAIKH